MDYFRIQGPPVPRYWIQMPVVLPPISDLIDHLHGRHVIDAWIHTTLTHQDDPLLSGCIVQGSDSRGKIGSSDQVSSDLYTGLCHKVVHACRKEADDNICFYYFFVALLCLVYVERKSFPIGMFPDLLSGSFQINIPKTDFPLTAGIIQEILNQRGGRESCTKDEDGLHQFKFED